MPLPHGLQARKRVIAVDPRPHRSGKPIPSRFARCCTRAKKANNRHDLGHNLPKQKGRRFQTPYDRCLARGSVQHGLSAAGGVHGFCKLGLAADKRYSLAMHIGTAVVRAFIAALAVLSLVSCGKVESSPVVSILTNEPSNEIPLVGGDLVVFKVSVRAQGLRKPGQVALVVQSEGILLKTSELTSIADGTTATLQVSVPIPQGTSVQLLTPLYVEAGQDTSVLDVRNYKVVGKGG